MPSNEIKNDLTKYNEAPESDYEQQSGETSQNLVYDFLYHDARRIASFLAQFETYGAVQLIKATESSSHATAVKTGISASGGVPLIAKGEAVLDRTTTDAEQDSADLTYDPLWKHAQTLLHSLESADLINDDLRSARVGRFVMVSGALAVLDLGTLKTLWDNKSILSFIASGLDGQSGQKPRQNRVNNAAMSQVKTVTDVLKALPHGVQARLGTSEGDLVWSALQSDSLVGSSADLLMEHGSMISGTWKMFGVLSAVPDDRMQESDLATRTVSESFLDIAQMMWALAPVARNALGRPATAYGMTPLLIFCEVTGDI